VAGLAVADMVCQQVDPSLSVTWSIAGARQGLQVCIMGGESEAGVAGARQAATSDYIWGGYTLHVGFVLQQHD
jgi:hypothetical protein